MMRTIVTVLALVAGLGATTHAQRPLDVYFIDVDGSFTVTNSRTQQTKTYPVVGNR